MGYTLEAVLGTAAAAYYAPPDEFAGDMPDIGVTAECGKVACEGYLGRCPVCSTPMCEEHPAAEKHVDTKPMNGCEGWAHRSCHDQTCRDRACWFEG